MYGILAFYIFSLILFLLLILFYVPRPFATNSLLNIKVFVPLSKTNFPNPCSANHLHKLGW